MARPPHLINGEPGKTKRRANSHPLNLQEDSDEVVEAQLAINEEEESGERSDEESPD